VAGVFRPLSGRTGGEARTAAGPATSWPRSDYPASTAAGPATKTRTHHPHPSQPGHGNPGPPEPSLRDLLMLLDWIRDQAGRDPRHPADDPIQAAALSLLDGTAAMLRIHRPGTHADGSLYCAVCLSETGSHAWPCQTVRAFGLAALAHWLPRVPPWLGTPPPR
jgi:hypothetical protein